MRRTRLSIAGLMAYVVMAAVGMAALRTPSPFWANLVDTLTLAGLGLAVPGIACRRGVGRAFWVGYATFGWGYWLASESPWIGDAMRPRLMTTAALEELGRWRVEVLSRVTDEARDAFLALPNVQRLEDELVGLDRRIAATESRLRNPADPALVHMRGLRADAMEKYEAAWTALFPDARGLLAAPSPGSGRVAATPEVAGRFQTVGHGLLSLLSGLVGGIIAVRYFRTRGDDSCPADAPSSSPRSTT